MAKQTTKPKPKIIAVPDHAGKRFHFAAIPPLGQHGHSHTVKSIRTFDTEREAIRAGKKEYGVR